MKRIEEIDMEKFGIAEAPAFYGGGPMFDSRTAEIELADKLNEVIRAVNEI